MSQHTAYNVPAQGAWLAIAHRQSLVVEIA